MNHVEKMIFYFWYSSKGGKPFNRVCIPLTISIPWIAVMQKQGDNDGKTKGLNILNENQPLIQISDDGVTHAFFEWQQIGDSSNIWAHCSIKQSSLHAAIVVVSNLIFLIFLEYEWSQNLRRIMSDRLLPMKLENMKSAQIFDHQTVIFIH